MFVVQRNLTLLASIRRIIRKERRVLSSNGEKARHVPRSRLRAHSKVKISE
jgi:hypothetical protein